MIYYFLVGLEDFHEYILVKKLLIWIDQQTSC